jgi:exodeoxyribonuclease-1
MVNWKHMAASFFFYDLETTGTNPREDRIMQFAGQRTDVDFNPIGEPVNLLIKLTPEVVPSPDAIMLTGITPQSTLQDGLTEHEFLQEFYDSVVQPDTVFLGFNTVRFDDEFMRYLHYRNFYDAYEWQWCDKCSRWDILDLVRMTRALRPEGIEWPFREDGAPTNRLELMTKLNGLDHDHAHDALSDVWATIAVAKLIRDKQPKLFEHLLKTRSKREVHAIVESGQVFTYTSGKYPKEVLHTTAAVLLAPQPGEANKDCLLVYDLRHDPTPFINMSVDEIVDAWSWSRDREKLRLPVKTLKCNRCPAVVPGFPKDTATQDRLQLSQDTATKHLQILNKHKDELTSKVLQALDRLNQDRSEKFAAENDCDCQLYDSMIQDDDKPVMRAIRGTKPAEIMEYQGKLRDKRLQQILPRYKARNFPNALDTDERQEWDKFCYHRLMDGGDNGRLGRYFKRLEELAAKSEALSEDQRYLLEELQLYGESIMPVLDGGET